MKIPMTQILEDEGVQRTICLIVQGELEEVNKCVAEKVEQLRLKEEEIVFLKGKVVELERANEKKSVEVRELQRQLQNEKARQKMTDKKPLVVVSSRKSERSKIVKREELNLDRTIAPFIATASKEPSTAASVKTTYHVQDIRKDGWVCVCGLEFNAKSNLEMHCKYHRAGYLFSCTKCPTRFVHATDMRKHLKTVHKVQPEVWMRYGCRLCGCFFMKITELLNHRKTSHGKANRIERDNRGEGPSRPVEKTPALENRHGFFTMKSVSTRSNVKNMISEIHSFSSHRFACHCGKDYSTMRGLERHVGTMDIHKD